ncbi:MAG: transposase [Chitinispirillia bacterium]
MNLLQVFIQFLTLWSPFFRQSRSLIIAIRLSIGLVTIPGRKTISRAICGNGLEQVDWSSNYKFFSRSPWESRKLFLPAIDESIKYSRHDYIGIGFDDTAVAKTGKHIPGVSYCRDPMSPPFNVNLILGKRFLQASALLPMYDHAEVPCLATPIAFLEVPPVKKPSKKAGENEWIAYKEEKKKRNMSHSFNQLLRDVRKDYDNSGAKNAIIVAATDGSFCNKTVFCNEVERTRIVSRCRKNAKLCFKDTSKSRRFYAKEKFTPEQIRQDEKIPYLKTDIYFGSQNREVKYKCVEDIYWQGGAKRRPLRLIVLAPTPYRLTKKSRRNYRMPAYLLTTALDIPISILIQIYFDRFHIEFNFRDEKQYIGVGDAQVRNPRSVKRQPCFVVASYSLLLLAALSVYGPERTAEYLPLPKWRNKSKAKRASSLDIIQLLRKNLCENPEIVKRYNITTSALQLTTYSMN